MKIYEYAIDDQTSGDTLYYESTGDWYQHTPAFDYHSLLSDVLLEYTFEGNKQLIRAVAYNPYEHLTLQELLDILDRLDIKVECVND